MSATPAYAGKVEIAPDSSGSPGTFAALTGAEKADFDVPTTLVETTPLGGGGNKTRTATTLDTALSVSCPYDVSVTAVATLIAAHTGASRGVQVWVKFWQTGSKNIQAPMLVEDIKYSEDANGVSMMDISLKGNGAQTVT